MKPKPFRWRCRSHVGLMVYDPEKDIFWHGDYGLSGRTLLEYFRGRDEGYVPAGRDTLVFFGSCEIRVSTARPLLVRRARALRIWNRERRKQ